MIVQKQDYVEFKRDFFAGAFGDQRFGQAFFNTFLTAKDDPDGKIFYGKVDETMDLVEANFVMWD